MRQYNWKSIESPPTICKENEGREFLVKGYFQSGGSRGKMLYKILKQDKPLPKNYGFMFERPSGFNIVEWCMLPDINLYKQ